jgi:RHS repeat-associated protein
MALPLKTQRDTKSDQKMAVPSLSLPKGGGAIRGIGEKFAANPVMGTGSMTVPIATSPGRSGFGPQISLTYDSSSGNGPFGFGWSSSLPAITRKTDKGMPQYRDVDESDVYVLSGAEDLVPVLEPNGTRYRDNVTAPNYVIHRYRPRIEGLFARIERWTDVATHEIHWRSITRDNVTTLYGKDNSSRIFDPADPSPTNPTRVFSWLIRQSYDDKGNAIIYEYAAENDENVDQDQVSERNRMRTSNRYLKRIKYGNRKPNRDVTTWQATDPTLLPDDTWMFEMLFDYGEAHYEEVPLDQTRPEAEQHRFVRASALTDMPWDSHARGWATRPDPFSTYRAGFEVRTYRRCRRILMFHHIPDLPTGQKGYEGLVRSTDFDYADLDYAQTVTIEQELSHQGSTRFASFIRAVSQSGYVRDDAQASVVRNGVQYAIHLKKSLPPLEFEYSKALIQDRILELDAASIENLPAGVDGSGYQWVDLDGEGVSGVLTEQAGVWFYKPSLGEGHLGPLRTVAAKPSLASLGTGSQQLLDLDGSGKLDLVDFAGPTPGFYDRTEDENWKPFQTFRQMPNIRWDEPNLRFVDLDGDGRADVLITEDQVFTWYPSLAKDGFAAAKLVRKPADEEKGPSLVFADGTQSVYLADMSGDGLSDVVRIRNGEVCYWPNLGYGRFSAKVTIDNSPWFDNPGQFDQRRVRLADIDGSGTNDIIYLAGDGVRLYFNQSGNRLSEARPLAQFPHVDNISSVMTADLLGNGTACLVCSSPLPGDARQPVRYIDLMGGTKPHLLVKSVNNLGAETQVHYAPSTKFYLKDKRDGKPWITRLPFPVHVVERVETYDRISRNHFVTRYACHHGYFDGIEREFRGFGMVEQWDTEEFASFTESGDSPEAANIDAASHVPPVLTRTWFHTGVYVGHEHVSDFFAGLLDADDKGEYYREPGLNDVQARALLLDDTVLPDGLSPDELREACRALKGSMLRQEVYALDGAGSPEYPYGHPYTVTEQNFTIEKLQSKGNNRHGVFFTHPRESLSYHYEREPADPRVGHAMTLKVDDYGNILKSAAIGYGRRHSDLDLSPADQAKQSQILIIYTENSFSRDHDTGNDAIDQDNDYRTPLPSESRTYELTGLTLTAGSDRFTFDEVVHAGTTAIALDYEMAPTAGRLEKRLIEHARTYYRRNDLTGPLPLGELQSLGLPFDRYKLAFTPSLVAEVYGGRVSDAMLENEGRYVHNEGDANWWIPSGLVFYSLSPADTPLQELAHARQHFFLPHRYRDPFHTVVVSTESFVSYDVHDLLVQETRDALGNRVTVGERNLDPTQPLVRPGHDYRVLKPAVVMEPNRNRSAVIFDAFGSVVGSAVMGKPDENPVPGDRLAATFRPDLTQAEIEQFLANPKGPLAVTLLDDATTRIIYDLTGYWREPDRRKKPPGVAATLARETHASELAPADGLRIQVNFSYSDGFGREIQKKFQAEPGPVPKRSAFGTIIVGADGQPEMTTNHVSPRWVGSGWMVFNNKGKLVRQYEPFFTDAYRFEFDVRIGISPLLLYDPVERVVAILHPNHTWEKVVFDQWRHETWDGSDTVVVADPKTDRDVGDFFARMPDTNYLPTWHALRTDVANVAAFAARYPDATDRVKETRAAEKTRVHAATPTVAYADSLGRTFLTVTHNKFKFSDSPTADPPIEEFHRTQIILDIEGNQREVIDAKDRVVMRYGYDMLGNRVHQSNMEAGERWMLNDVTGKPLYAWDSRKHQFRTAYDPLRRPTDSFLSEGAGAETVVGRTIYGETRPNPEATNLRGKPAQLFDQVGVVTNDDYDFKGNLLRSQRRLAQSYKTTLDWSGAVPLEPQAYSSRTRYDALNRPIQLIPPHSDQLGTTVNIIEPIYNETNLLEQVHAWLNQNTEPAGRLDVSTASLHAITDINYDAKGQRTLIDYGNGARTTYTYDPLTFRLARLLTRRDAVAFPSDCPQPPPVGWPGCQMQNLHYTYDPAGNITHIRDDAQQTIYFRNKCVEPSAEYTYDAVYRLIEATGREHLGQVGGQPIPHSYNDAPRVSIGWSANDGNAMGTYMERYIYDAADNMLEMQHHGGDPANPGWTRSYAYNEASLLEPGKHSGRLSSSAVGNASPVIEQYGYDAHGSMIRMLHLQIMQWDFKDQLQMTQRQAVNGADADGMQHHGERTWYVYDFAGQRVRKIIELDAGQVKDERIYFGGFEIYRRHGANPLVRETLNLTDDKQRIALVETRIQGSEPGVPAQLIRYQFGNHLGSANMELDDRAQIISYEEYTPYGSTSYQAVRSQTETPKRYRYAGKERDEESGFYYHGARHYAPWLARWTSADPIGIEDLLSLFVYSSNNPVKFIDPDGKEIVISYKQGDETKTVTYSYQKGRKVDEKAPTFLKNTLKSLDYLTEKKAMKITIGEGKSAKSVDVLDSLVKDKSNKVTITEGTGSTGNVYTPATNTIEFVHDQAAKFRKDSSKPWSAENTGRTSPAGLLAHELIHSYNDLFDPENYKTRRADKSSKTEDKFSFPNKEEEYVTKDLANKVLNKLGEDSRQNYGKNYYPANDPTSVEEKAAPKPAEEKKPAAPTPTKPPDKKGATNFVPDNRRSPTIWSGLDMRFRSTGAI